MKNFFIKSVVAVLAFTIGISAVYLSHSYSLFVTHDSHKLTLLNDSSPMTNTLVKDSSNKIEIRFVRFVQNESRVEAEFELTNNTAETAYYSSYGKGIYPFPELKRNGKIVQDIRMRCGTGIKEHTLLSGETVFYRVPKYEITYELTKDSWKETNKPTQVGFPLTIGKERRKEIIWSEEIMFPKQ